MTVSWRKAESRSSSERLRDVETAHRLREGDEDRILRPALVGGVEAGLPLVELLRAHPLVHGLVREIVGARARRRRARARSVASPSGRRARPGSSRSARTRAPRTSAKASSTVSAVVIEARARRRVVESDAVDGIEVELDDAEQAAVPEARGDGEGAAAVAILPASDDDHGQEARVRGAERAQDADGGGGEGRRAGPPSGDTGQGHAGRGR